MELRETVLHRRMVRRFDPAGAVAPEVVRDLVALAVRAPSAGFSQGWDFLALLDPADREAFWSATDDGTPPDAWRRGVSASPALVLCLSDPDAYLDRYAQPDKGWTDEDEARWPVPFWHIDTGMAALLILQTVTDAGLGACYFGIPPERVVAVRDAFAIPETFDPIGAITIGHRTTTDGLPGSPSVRPRKAQADVVHRGRWA